MREQVKNKVRDVGGKPGNNEIEAKGGKDFVSTIWAKAWKANS